jgi:hypothetical protein
VFACVLRRDAGVSKVCLNGGDSGAVTYPAANEQHLSDKALRALHVVLDMGAPESMNGEAFILNSERYVRDCGHRRIIIATRVACAKVVTIFSIPYSY